MLASECPPIAPLPAPAQVSNSSSLTSTTEPNTYLEAASVLSSATAESAEACAKSCMDTSNCYVWTWCPSTEASG